MSFGSPLLRTEILPFLITFTASTMLKPCVLPRIAHLRWKFADQVTYPKSADRRNIALKFVSDGKTVARSGMEGFASG